MDIEQMPCTEIHCQDCDWWMVSFDGNDGDCTLPVSTVEND